MQSTQRSGTSKQLCGWRTWTWPPISWAASPTLAQPARRSSTRCRATRPTPRAAPGQAPADRVDSLTRVESGTPSQPFATATATWSAPAWIGKRLPISSPAPTAAMSWSCPSSRRRLSLDPDQDVHAIAKGAAQAVNGGRALHRPALDNARRNRIELVRPDEMRHAFNPVLLAGHPQPHPRVGSPASSLFRKAEAKQIHHARWRNDEPHRDRPARAAISGSDQHFLVVRQQLKEVLRQWRHELKC